MHTRRVPRKSHTELGSDWDALAEVRHEQTVSGLDLSFDHVLIPTLLELANGIDMTRVIDIGCGTGVTTRHFAARSNEIVGVDLSAKSIKLAQAENKDLGSVSFVQATIEDYSLRARSIDFSVAFANMVLMNTPDLESALDAISRILVDDGILILTITHPCFWPQYAGYQDEPWYSYKEEIFVSAPFKISLNTENTLNSTHVHRSLESYINTLFSLGFIVEKLVEPVPKAEVALLYPEKWRYPRFLALRCRLRKPTTNHIPERS